MKKVIAVLSCVCLLLQGCASMQTVQVPQGGSGTPAVQVGDSVEVTTRAGQVHRFEVTEMTNDALVGKDTRVAYADITELKAARQDKVKLRKVLWIVGGIALLVAFIGAGSSGGSGY
jgi:hypothetical protein